VQENDDSDVEDYEDEVIDSIPLDIPSMVEESETRLEKPKLRNKKRICNRYSVYLHLES